MSNDKGYIAKARAHLEAHGETRMSDLADAVGIETANLNSSLRGPISRGEFLKRKEGRCAFVRLPENEPGGVDEAQDAEEDADPIRWTHWDDGDIVMYGLVENNDGSHTIPAAVVQAIKNRLAWSPVR